MTNKNQSEQQSAVEEEALKHSSAESKHCLGEAQKDMNHHRRLAEEEEMGIMVDHQVNEERGDDEKEEMMVVKGPEVKGEFGGKTYYHFNPGNEMYSRKVFVGGLPIDIAEEELYQVFSKYGSVIVDWPHKNQVKVYYPPKGYVFLVFEEEQSVQELVSECYEKDNRYYMCVSSLTMTDKPVQIRPWKLADADFVCDTDMTLDPRKTIFIGGVPRPLKAIELACVMHELYGGVCYAGIDTDPELKYPKGAGRVSFGNQQSFMAAIAAKFVHLRLTDVDKRVEVKPYILDEQQCDECGGARCSMKYAQLFCPDVSCLQYYCDMCWGLMHGWGERQQHRPLIKENSDRRQRASGMITQISGGLNGASFFRMTSGQ